MANLIEELKQLEPIERWIYYEEILLPEVEEVTKYWHNNGLERDEYLQKGVEKAAELWNCEPGEIDLSKGDYIPIHVFSQLFKDSERDYQFNKAKGQLDYHAERFSKSLQGIFEDNYGIDNEAFFQSELDELNTFIDETNALPKEVLKDPIDYDHLFKKFPPNLSTINPSKWPQESRNHKRQLELKCEYFRLKNGYYDRKFKKGANTIYHIFYSSLAAEVRGKYVLFKNWIQEKLNEYEVESTLEKKLDDTKDELSNKVRLCIEKGLSIYKSRFSDENYRRITEALDDYFILEEIPQALRINFEKGQKVSVKTFGSSLYGIYYELRGKLTGSHNNDFVQVVSNLFSFYHGRKAQTVHKYLNSE